METSQDVMNFEISSADWKFVEALLEEVDKEESRNNFFAAFYTWQNAIKILRTAEHLLLEDKTPTTMDLTSHAMLLHMLIAAGKALQLQYEGLHSDSKKILKFSGADLTASVYELQISLDERHGDVDSVRIDNLKSKLFGAN